MSGTISQRELRNDNADVMRRVETGERFVVTQRGVPVADLVPHREDGDRRETFVPTSEIVAKARGDRGWDRSGFVTDARALDDVFDDDQRDPWT